MCVHAYKHAWLLFKGLAKDNNGTHIVTMVHENTNIFFFYQWTETEECWVNIWNYIIIAINSACFFFYSVINAWHALQKPVIWTVMLPSQFCAISSSSENWGEKMRLEKQVGKLVGNQNTWVTTHKTPAASFNQPAQNKLAHNTQ